MRTVISFVLVISLISSTALTAQQNVAVGPTAGVIAPEAARLGGDPQTQAFDNGWSRVRKLAPGTVLIVTMTGSELTTRYFVSGDESHISVLNVNGPDLPAPAKDVLRQVASTHPSYLPAAQRGEQFLLEHRVRVGPDGVFVADRKVADLAHVLEEYRRQDVTEIKTTRTGANRVGCALAAYYEGALVGGLPGVLIGGVAGRAAGGDTGVALVGMMVGWSIGGMAMYGKCRHPSEKTIYSAP